jgi:hypothetical protein
MSFGSLVSIETPLHNVSGRGRTVATGHCDRDGLPAIENPVPFRRSCGVLATGSFDFSGNYSVFDCCLVLPESWSTFHYFEAKTAQ